MSEYCLGTMNTNSLVYSNICNSTRWLTEEVFSLIDLVQRNEAIYNPRHKYYFCRPYVENFWREVDNKLEKNSGASLAKWTNLRISFRREYTNYLEEKVPPCWTYFDRMFFLHPYLRKKHQQVRPLDGQIQDALEQFNSISNRLKERDNSITSDLNVNETTCTIEKQLRKSVTASLTNINPLETYLEYLDEVEPTPSELDDMSSFEEASNERTVSKNERCHYTSTTALVNNIKLECEDNMDELETEHHTEVDDLPVSNEEDHLLNPLGLNHIEKRQLQQQQRLHHIHRLQTRALYEDFCVKRLRLQDTSSGVGPSLTGNQNLSSSLPVNAVISSSNHSNNVSLVRPTLAKPVDNINSAVPLNAINNNLLVNVSGSLTSHNSNSSNNNSVTNVPMSTSQPTDFSDKMNTMVNSRMATSSSHYHHNHHHHPMMHNNRYEVSLVTPSNFTNFNPNTVQTTATSSPELCDCKTDPDAMFLMSLLPDIQKLNGRDRGKIKIAFQNILQDYLYPD